MKTFRIILWILVLIVFAYLIFNKLQNKYAPQQHPTFYPEIEGIYIEPQPRAQTIPDFSLQGDGFTWSNKDLQGKWSLLYFGYTFCPDICPASMGLLSTAASLLKDKIPAASLDKIQGALVSVDPERDTPELLKKYVDFFNPKFVGVTGEVEQIDKLVKKFGVFYDFPDGKDKSINYPVSHSSSFILINPRGEFQAVLTEQQKSLQLANDIALIINFWNDSQAK
jgi:protein SCO1/2